MNLVGWIGRLYRVKYEGCISACELSNEGTMPMQDDPNHPIPAIGEIDLYGIKNNGGADLAIVIASPLDGDENSQRRLLAKIEGYLSFVSSDEFKSEAEPANRENTSIAVHIHPASAPEIFELLDRCRTWVEENAATLRVERLQNES